ncbi:MAG: ribulose,5-biphosphate synthetase [Paenibacillus sp.]|jgi:hypothetical protein|nr:ribulose,5-biphosphate synthetase [Paenibacillus sp.]
MPIVREPERVLETGGEFDVIVCGGGPAGIVAALAAARSGAKTCIIEAHGCLGGIWTSGLLSYVLDGGTKGGIMQELFSRMEQLNARNNGVIFDVETMKFVLERLCAQAGVDVRLLTQVVAAYRDDHGRLEAVVTESKSGREAWCAKVFIDTTGDGDVAAQAGCEFAYGEEKSGVAQPMSLNALVTAGPPEPFAEFTSNTQARGIRLLAEAERAGMRLSYRNSSMWHIRDGLYLMMANHQYGVSGLNANDLTRATIHARQEINQLVQALRSLGGIWKDLRLVATANQIGVREGRRIKGRYTVLVDDIMRGLKHEDGICRVHFNFDVHSPHPDEQKGMERYNAKFHEYRARKQPYDIPLRALIAKDVDGLLMAGRCISGDFLSHSSYRVTGNAVAMGQAAGTLAALSVRTGLLPHQVPWSEVRQRLGEFEHSAGQS